MLGLQGTFSLASGKSFGCWLVGHCANPRQGGFYPLHCKFDPLAIHSGMK